MVVDTQPQEKKLPVHKSIYLLPNLITSLSMFMGFLSMVWAVQSRFEEAGLAIVLSALLDGMDGKVARLTHTASEFGVQYDSLADLIAFGLAPAFLLWQWQLESLGRFGVVFIAVTLALFSFSTFLGILYYARCNVAYLFGDRWLWQTAYKVLALVMLVVGGMEAYTVVWDLGDVGIGLMTIFNMLALYPLSGEALTALREYEAKKKLK